MPKLFTLVAAGLLAATSLTAHAQATVFGRDGVLSASELTGDNPYQLLGKFTNPRGFGDYGLLSVYASVNKGYINLFIAGTVQDNGNSFQVYFRFPPASGVAKGTALPGVSGATTSFARMTAKMDMPVSAAVAVRFDPNTKKYVLEEANYAVSPATSQQIGSLSYFSTSGQWLGLYTNSSAVPAFDYLLAAYHPATTIKDNPGYRASTGDAGYGGVGSYGLELELTRPVSSGTTPIQQMQLFVLQNNDTGSYLSSDYLPQATTPPTANNGNLGDPSSVDFANIPGTQAYYLNLGQPTGVTLPTRAEAAPVALGVYPNPVAGAATVSYRVATASTPVRVELLDLLGRVVRVLDSGSKPVGDHHATLEAGPEAAGTYLVRVQVGDEVATSKVALH